MMRSKVMRVLMIKVILKCLSKEVIVQMMKKNPWIVRKKLIKMIIRF